MNYLSICSGIEAATVAWHPLGWKPVGFAEIEAFPAAVLAHHYPDIPNLGDMTKFKEWKYEPRSIDLLVGGTPCQAFSVAGLRRGLEDARGNLTLTFVEMADYFDPEWVVWENVPGVLSSKDNAFGCFLAGLSGASEPIEPIGKWPSSGVVSGPQRTVAWRICDAQYYGVAQRRRRVFVLAVRGAGNWRAAAALFPVIEGMHWDTAPSREAGQAAAPTVSSGAPFSRTGNERVEHQAVITMAHGQGGAEIAENRSPTLTCNHEAPIAAYGIPGNWIGRAPENGGNSTQFMEEVAPCLTSADKHGVAQPIPFDTTQITSPLNYSSPKAGDPCHPLAAGAHIPAVAQSMAVRRLTPVECERLQGFPDNYTNIKDKCPDGPRYKALGNSMAVPVMRYLGQRISTIKLIY